MSEQVNSVGEMVAARTFIDKNGGYQTIRTGVDKEAHDAWQQVTSWGLSRDDFIRLSYFNGDLDNGSDGSSPVNGYGNHSSDVVYRDGNSALTRDMVSEWLSHYTAFVDGYRIRAKQDATRIEELEAEHEQRRSDPYAHLKAAATDPTKQVQLIGVLPVIQSGWQDSGYPWRWNWPPDSYEIRDKPVANTLPVAWIGFDSEGGAVTTTKNHERIDLEQRGFVMHPLGYLTTPSVSANKVPNETQVADVTKDGSGSALRETRHIAKGQLEFFREMRAVGAPKPGEQS